MPKAEWRNVYSANQEVPPCLAALVDTGPNCPLPGVQMEGREKISMNSWCAVRVMGGFHPVVEQGKADKQKKRKREEM